MTHKLFSVRRVCVTVTTVRFCMETLFKRSKLCLRRVKRPTFQIDTCLSFRTNERKG